MSVNQEVNQQTLRLGGMEDFLDSRLRGNDGVEATGFPLPDQVEDKLRGNDGC